MSVKSLSRKVDQLTQKAQRKQGQVEFEVYFADEAPEGWEPDFEIDFGVAMLEEDEDDREL